MTFNSPNDFPPIEIINPLEKKVSVFESSWGTEPEDITIREILRLLKSDEESINLYGYNEARGIIKYYKTFDKKLNSLIQINSERRRYVTLCEQKIKNQFAINFGDIFGIEATEFDETQLEFIPAFDKESYSGKEGIDSKKKGGIKKSLYGFTPCATFTKRNGNSVIEPSGFIILDFDDISVEYVAEFKEHVTQDQHTFACWYSPSFEGVKALVRIPEYTHESTETTLTTHKSYIYSIQKYWNSQFDNLKHCLIHDSQTLKTGVLLDPRGDDITRLCYFNLDSNLFLNEDAEIWIKQEDVKVYKRRFSFTSNVIGDMNYSSQCHYEYEKGNSYKRSFPLANTISYHFGDKGYDLYRHILRKFPDEGLDSYWNSALRNNPPPNETAEKFLKKWGFLTQEKEVDKVEIITKNNSESQSTINKNDSYQLRLLNQEISIFKYAKDGIQLKEGEYLSNYIDYLKTVAKERKIHLWQVPAGGGKTELIKQLAKTHRVLVAVPVISIIRNKFENDITYKDDFKFCYDSGGIKAQLDSKKPNGLGHSIVSTFDQLSYINDISSIASRFDYIFIDESHELTLSYYRLKCTGKLITNLSNYVKYLQNPIYKEEHEAIPPASFILLTGTPCGEQQLFGYENVKLTRFLPTNNKEINIMVCGNLQHTKNTFVKILQEILSNENSLVFIPCNLGEIWINALMELVGCKDYMIYSKNESKSENVKFIDENGLIPENIKVIFGTKSAGCGLDFNNTDKKVTVLFPEMEVSAYIEQYISRFRKVVVVAYLFVQTINAKGREIDFGFDWDINKPYEYEFDEADYYYNKQAYFNSINTEDFGKSGAEMEAWNNDFVLNEGVLKQNELENRRYTYSKMFHKIKHYEMGLKEHESKLYPLCGGLMRLNYEPKLIKANLLHDNELVYAVFRELRFDVILRKNLRLKEYFESLLPYAGISFQGWNYERGEELKIEVELKKVTCPNFDEIKFVKRYLFKFFNLKSCEDFVRNEMVYWNKFSGCEILRSKDDLEKKIVFYKFCKYGKDIMVSFIDSIYTFWYDKGYSNTEVKEWEKKMCNQYLVKDYFELNEKTQLDQINRLHKILLCFGNFGKSNRGRVFNFITEYEQLKSETDAQISLLFNLDTGKNKIFLKLEEFKVGKKKGISFDHVSAEMLTEIETKMKTKEGLNTIELKKFAGLDNSKEIGVFMEQFNGVNKKRVRVNGNQVTNYYIVEL